DLGGLDRRSAARCSHPVTRTGPRHQPVLRDQPTVGGRYGKGAKFVHLGEVPNRRQDHAWTQKLLPDRALKRLHNLLDQGVDILAITDRLKKAHFELLLSAQFSFSWQYSFNDFGRLYIYLQVRANENKGKSLLFCLLAL